MLKLFITDRLDAKLPEEFLSARVLVRRKLTASEIRNARRLGIRRFYLPNLAFEDVAQFFAEFDTFWDQVIANFGKDHIFWRNVISSKMQEWEVSVGYLAVVLFTLTRISDPLTLPLLILTDSLEEENLIKAWAKRLGWEIVQSSPKVRWFRRIIQEARNFFRYLYLVFIAFRKKIFSAEGKGLLLPDKDRVLLASMFYPWSIKEGEYKDPFFGSLHEFLSKNGKQCLYLSDSIPIPKASTKSAVKECRNVILKMPLALLSWGKLIRILGRLFFRRIKLPEARFMGCDFSELFSWHARSFKFHFNWHAEVYYEAVKTLGQRHPFKELILIFEGNVFERACLQAIQKWPQVWTCGYSQGVIYPANLKLRMTPAERWQRPEPHRIVCTGSHARNSFGRIGNRGWDRLTCGCTLRVIPSFTSDNNLNSKTILVALDGVYNTVTVLDWLLEQEDMFKDYRIQLRGHPNVPLKEIQGQCFKEFPSNFTISDRSLEEDIQESGCVFYRHTSIGLQALVNGKPVVHLAIDCPLPGDPLEGVSLGKWFVSSPEEMKKALYEIGQLTQEESAAFKNARTALAGYFAPASEEALKDFLADQKEHLCLNRL